jgi:O-succinylbenzoate synthase
LALVAALRTALPAIELHLDANGAYPATALDRVCKIVDAGIDAFEQPFAPADRATAAALIDRIGDRGVPVVADEAVGSLRDARDLLEAGAMTGLSIKPARVGGLSIARKLHDLCVGHGLPATAGGMLETGLGRHALVALAGLPGFSLIGDLSPAGRWLAEDPWPDLTMTDGRLVVPDGPGVAPPPDLDTLERHLVDRRRIV